MGKGHSRSARVPLLPIARCDSAARDRPNPTAPARRRQCAAHAGEARVAAALARERRARPALALVVPSESWRSVGRTAAGMERGLWSAQLRLAWRGTGQRLRSVARYLLVDDRDGKVLAGLASAEQAVRLLSRLERTPQGDPPVSVVRLDHQQGDLTDVTSLVSMRPLPPLMARPTRRGRIKKSTGAD
jgi:hypothetical protein